MKTLAPAPRSLAVVGLSLGLLAACGGGEDNNQAAIATDTTAQTTTPMPSNSTAMPAAPSSTGTDTAMAMDSAMNAMDPNAAAMPPAKDAEQQFMRMMSDHHQGMIEMTNALLAKQGAGPEARADAQKLKAQQQSEQQQMLSMLQSKYNESFQPKSTPGSEKMVASISQANGNAVDKVFWANVVQHHQQALDMINRFAPRMTSPEMRQMADKMKTSQMQQIQEFKKEIGQA